MQYTQQMVSNARRLLKFFWREPSAEGSGGKNKGREKFKQAARNLQGIQSNAAFIEKEDLGEIWNLGLGTLELNVRWEEVEIFLSKGGSTDGKRRCFKQVLAQRDKPLQILAADKPTDTPPDSGTAGSP
ncbi:hypothetical protein PAAG_12145 [Paracoccidioides lutzii Pb01]|uniref:Uncharacterized protein n=1 Tax=Paracoccidioides lutzii (strain ATCC MYA-826 / Pb01) TaxID=502779 RepID=A0A0A2VK04_PARBA|nr:hypothetical protein PAAG_12145 [Paracoccidioides lutzii Pb01]KGQ01199.1 hypothetical protein PAAG_12145 [Paracoccidioides lutzii Pb01]